MRKLVTLVFSAFGLLFSAGTASADGSPPVTKQEVKLEFIHLEMSGVTSAEVAVVAKAASEVKGVKTFEWVSDGAEAKIVREVGTAADETLIKVMTTAGAETVGRVPLALANFTFDKKLHCGGCVATVNKALLGITGVKSSTVNAEMTAVAVVFDTRKVKTTDVEASLTSIQRPGKYVP